MKIKVILASSSQEFVKSQLEDRKKSLAAGTEITIVAPPLCPPSTETERDEVLAAPQILSEVMKAKGEGFDAVTIDCVLDPGLKAAKQASQIPVVGAGESAITLALLFGERFSVIMPTAASIGSMVARIRQMGLWNRLAAVRAIDLPVLALEDYQETVKAVEREARHTVEQEDADVIVLGCTVMGPIADTLADRLGVPVIDPGTAALKMAEAFVSPAWRSTLFPEGNS